MSTWWSRVKSVIPLQTNHALHRRCARRLRLLKVRVRHTARTHERMIATTRVVAGLPRMRCCPSTATRRRKPRSSWVTGGASQVCLSSVHLPHHGLAAPPRLVGEAALLDPCPSATAGAPASSCPTAAAASTIRFAGADWATRSGAKSHRGANSL